VDVAHGIDVGEALSVGVGNAWVGVPVAAHALSTAATALTISSTLTSPSPFRSPVGHDESVALPSATSTMRIHSFTVTVPSPLQSPTQLPCAHLNMGPNTTVAALSSRSTCLGPLSVVARLVIEAPPHHRHERAASGAMQGGNIESDP
jgi:hypothetical protein